MLFVLIAHLAKWIISPSAIEIPKQNRVPLARFPHTSQKERPCHVFSSPRARDLHETFNSYQLANKLAHSEDIISKKEKLIADLTTALDRNMNMVADMKANAAALNDDNLSLEGFMNLGGDYCNCGKTDCPLCFKN